MKGQQSLTSRYELGCNKNYINILLGCWSELVAVETAEAAVVKPRMELYSVLYFGSSSTADGNNAITKQKSG